MYGHVGGGQGTSCHGEGLRLGSRGNKDETWVGDFTVVSTVKNGKDLINRLRVN